MSQNNVQSAAAVVRVPGLVVAVGPFALHQEGPRHVFSCLGSEILHSSALHSSPRCSDLISRQIETLLVDGRDGVGIFGRLLRMCREAVSFNRCRRGQVAKRQVRRPPRRTAVDMGILYVLNGIAADKMEAEALKLTWLF